MTGAVQPVCVADDWRFGRDELDGRDERGDGDKLSEYGDIARALERERILPAERAGNRAMNGVGSQLSGQLPRFQAIPI